MRRGTSSLGMDVPSEREINRLAARSDEEFWMFEKMDEERRQKENYRSRLMEEREVPDWAYSTPDNREDKSKGLFDNNITGKRRRKEVVYADTLSDLQWMRGVENGQDLSTISIKGKRREIQTPLAELNEFGSHIVGEEKKVEELRNENSSMVSEGTSEDSFSLGRVFKSEGETIEKDESGWNGHVLRWNNIHKRKRSSYGVQSSSSDGKGQNSNGRGNGWI